MKAVSLSLILIAAVLWMPLAFAETPETAKVSKLKSAAADEALNTKVNDIVKTQEKILKQLEEIKKELEIVKIRATI